MKRIFKNFMALSLGLALVAAGCSKDKDKTVAEEIAGNYVGTIAVYGAPVAQDVPITITADGENVVVLKINTTLSVPTVGNLSLNVECNAVVTKTEDNYTLKGSSTVSLPLLSETPLPFTLEGTVTSAGTASLTIAITISPGTPLLVSFSGTKQ